MMKKIAPWTPIRDSPTNTSSSKSVRWWTIQRSSRVSRLIRSGGDELLGRLDQLLRVERLADEARRAPGGRGLQRLLLDLAAEHDHRDRADTVPFVNAAQHLPTVHLGHHH